MTVQVPESRYTIEKFPDGIRITIPVENNLFPKLFSGLPLLFLPILVGGLLFFFATLIAYAQYYFRPYSNSFFIVLIVNLIVFILVTLLFLYASKLILTFIWQVAGKEIIDIVERYPLMIRRDFRILKLFHEYSHEKITNLKLARKSGAAFFFRISQTPIYAMLRRKHGNIAFDYGKKTIYFGDGLDDIEANQIISLLREYLPNEPQP